MNDNPEDADKGGGKDLPEPIERPANVVVPAPQKIDLRDVHAMRRELASVYRDMRGGRIKSQDGTRLAYVLYLLCKAYETGVLNDRLEILEHTLKGRKDES